MSSRGQLLSHIRIFMSVLMFKKSLCGKVKGGVIRSVMWDIDNYALVAQVLDSC